MAQGLLHGKHAGPYTYIYKLTIDQTLKILKNDFDFPHDLLEKFNPLDSFPPDSNYDKTLPFGEYVFVTPKFNELQVDFTPKHSFTYEIMDNGRQVDIFVNDKHTGTPIDTATVMINGEKLTYLAGTGTYHLDKFPKKSKLLIILGDQIYYTSLYSCGLLSKKVTIDYTNTSSENKYNGFIAFSKPRYQPGDTLKLKAWLCKKNGNPLTKKVRLYCRSNGYYYNYHWKTANKLLTVLKPVTPGAYIFEMVITDSMEMNSSYNFHFRTYRKKKFIKGAHILLEDYQLREVRYSARPVKEEFNVSDTVALLLYGTDANGQPVLDGSASIKLKSGTITAFTHDSLFIPDKLWETKVNLNPNGETKVIIPPAVLPDARMYINAQISFTNSNSEMSDTTIDFFYDNRQELLKIRTDSQYLVVEYFDHSQLTKKNGKVIINYNFHEKKEKNISFPYREKFDGHIEFATFMTDQISETFYLRNYDPKISCEGYRIDDSVYFNLINPLGLDVYYTLFRGKNEVKATGKTGNFKWSTIDAGETPWFMKCNYYWHGEMKNANCAAIKPELNLTISTDEPNMIYPGQKVKVQVQLKDPQNKPLAGANLTAGAVNAQFSETNVPDVPFLYQPLPHRNYEDYYDNQVNPYTKHIPLSSKMLSKWGLDSINYYKFLFPVDGIYQAKEPIQTGNAQFAPFVFKNGIKQPIYLILVDNKLIYYYDNSNNRYSFVLNPGKHKIIVRTREKEYSFVAELSNGYKTIVSIDADNPPPQVIVKKVGKKLSKFEKLLINYSTLVLEEFTNGSKMGFWQDNRYFIADQYYFRGKWIGPFMLDSINVDVPGYFSSSFDFEPCYQYTIFSKKIKMVKMPCNYISIPMLPPYINHNQDLHDLAISKIDYENWKLNTHGYNNNYYSESNSKTKISSPSGRLKIKFNPDSFLSYIALTRLNAPSTVEKIQRDASEFNNLLPGFYRLIFATAFHYYFVLDSILIRPEGQTLLNLDKGNFKYNYFDSTQNCMTLSRFFAEEHRKSPTDFFKSTIIFGIIKKGYSRIPQVGVAIKIFYRDSLIASTLTNGIGWFSLKVPSSGLYQMKVSFPGVKTDEYNDILCFPGISYERNISFNTSGYESDGLLNNYRTNYNRNRRSLHLVRHKPAYKYKSSNSSIKLYCPRFLDGANYETGYNTSNLSELNSFRGNIYTPRDFTVNWINGPHGNYTESGAISGKSSLSFPGDPYQNRTRTSFSDCGYWVPNLVTDENGQATFEVTFPDNLTKWKTFVAAIDDKKHSGLILNEIKSTKTLVASLSYPRFLVEGDSSFLLGKILNYSKNPVKLLRTINTPAFNLISDTTVYNAIIEKIPLNAAETDTLQATYSIKTASGYADGERREIAVYPAGMEEKKGYFLYLDKDTTVNLEFPKDGSNWQIYAQDNPIKFMLDEIDKVDQYPYFCMEQTASKLSCLLMEKKIRAMMGEKCRNDRKIEKMIRILENGQNEDGSWGWWSNSTSSIWMTAYVTKALQQASNMDFYTTGDRKGIDYFKDRLEYLDSNDLLTAVEVIATDRAEFPISRHINRLMKYHFTGYRQLQLLRILQLTGNEYDISQVTGGYKKTMFGNYYWGEKNYNWYDDNHIVGMTLLAYQIIENNDSNSTLLPRIANYFLEYKSSESWKNTIETSSILETILPLMLKNKPAKLRENELAFKGTIQTKIKSFPYSTTLEKPDSQLTIRKTGSTPVYLTAWSSHFNKNPKTNSVKFNIKTRFETDGQEVPQMQAGKLTEMVTTIKTEYRSNYVMIIIPIPAGCSYASEKSEVTSFETHREYFRDRVVIFCETFPAGQFTFRIKLEPRYTGSYTLNPAKAELMYFPVFSGNNEIKKVRIGD